MERAHAEVKMLKVQNCRTITNAPSASLEDSRGVIARHGPASACIAAFLGSDNLPYRYSETPPGNAAGRSEGEALKSRHWAADLSIPNVKVVPDI
jgi:hypothetical protein